MNNLLDPSMKERLLQWLVFVMVITLISGGNSDSKDDEDEKNNYDIKTNEVDEHDDPTSQMLHLINEAAMKIVTAPDLSNVIKYNLKLYCS